MTYTYMDLLSSILGTVAFPMLLFAPGYCLAWLTNLFRFRTQSWPEQVLWSIALSLPLSLVLSNIGGRSLSSTHILHCFEAIAVASLALMVPRLKKRSLPVGMNWSREATIVSLCMIGVAAYCLFEAIGIQIHNHLYESSLSQDWSVRIQLVNAAVRGGVPPLNPMFAVDGHAPPLRYYYYWYVLCAQICRLTGIDAKSALTASCVWSGFAFVACTFLSLKYLSISSCRPRREYVTALLVACVLGLDVIPSTIGLLLPRLRLYPDIEFWLSDRSPGWLGALLWAPHHVAGLVCCVLGIIALANLPTNSNRLPKLLLHTLVAAFCFSAAAGTSTYITLFFVLFCILWLIDLLWRRDWPTAMTLILAGVVSLALSHSFIHEMLFSAAVKSDGSGHHLLQIGLRGNNQARSLINYVLHWQLHKPIHAHNPPSLILLRLPIILGLYFLEFGFFLIVLAHRIQADFLSGKSISRNGRILWLLFASFAIPGFFLSSASLQGNNDLGRHAGMGMRFVLLLWAVPLVQQMIDVRRTGQVLEAPKRRLVHIATAAMILGLTAQAWQIVILRIYIPLVDSGRIRSTVVALRFPNISGRFYDIRRAADAINAVAPKTAIVQTNPDGRLQPIVALYLNRQFAAIDDGCEIPFGGDAKACAAVVRPLIALYGGTGKHHSGDPASRPRIAFDPADVTPISFNFVCATQSLWGLAAVYSDPAWHDPESWVWQLKPIYANGTMRVFHCPLKNHGALSELQPQSTPPQPSQ